MQAQEVYEAMYSEALRHWQLVEISLLTGGKVQAELGDEEALHTVLSGAKPGQLINVAHDITKIVTVRQYAA